MLGSHRFQFALVLVAVAAWSPRAEAHFALTSPPAVYEEDALGNPQKAPPCGADGTEVVTDVITDFTPGETITITIEEKIFHPGHYRVALAVNDPSELPDEPMVTAASTPCGSAEIDPMPTFPVLADGVLQHDTPFGGPQSFDVTLPSDINCDNCTLQVIEFMSNHALNNPGGCFYHHCAQISMHGATTDSSGDGSMSSSGGGTGSSATSGGTSAGSATSGASSADSATSSASGGADGADGGADGGTAAGGTAAGTAGSGGGADGGSDGSDGGGCGCRAAPGGAWGWLMLLPLGVVVRRRLLRR